MYNSISGSPALSKYNGKELETSVQGCPLFHSESIILFRGIRELGGGGGGGAYPLMLEHY